MVRPIWLAVGIFLVGAAASVAAPPAAGPSEHGCFAKPDGETFFVLSLTATLPQPENRPQDVLIYFDTSASQTAIYRDKGLAALDALLEDLGPDDRVHIMAVDIDVVPMTEGFAGAKSPATKAGVAKLKKRTPLGATDMGIALEVAAKSFSKSDHGRVVVYLGDGMSAANIMLPEALDKLLLKMVEQRISFNAYSFGPRRDNELLGAIANHTGGNLVVDFPEKPARNFARDLSNSVHGSVFWPSAVKLPAEVVESYPKRFPPIRTDRDTIVLGRGKFTAPFEVKATVDHAGHAYPITWKIEPKPSSVEHSPLVDLMVRCKHHDGVGLATVGRGGLIETYRALNKNVQSLVELAKTALRTENPEQAELLAKSALEVDPTHPEGLAILNAVERIRKAAKEGANDPTKKLPPPKQPEKGLKIGGDKTPPKK